MIPTSHLSSTSLFLFFFFFLLLLLLSIASSSSVELASSDHRTLLRLNRLLSYPSQLSILNSTSLCSLPPTTSLTLSCTSSGRLSSFLLTGNSSLTSTSPSLSSILPTLSHLRSLSHLTLSSLSLIGPLPTTLSHLPPSLNSLDLSSNLLSGHLPDNLLHLHSLHSLDLSSNLLNGSLPDLSNLTTLSNLDLSYNHLSGTIPNSIITLPAISTLNLSGNAFSGELTSPSAGCGDLLTVVDVSYNRLVGKLPECISSNTSRAVRVVDAWNCLTSPSAIGNFQHPPSYCAERPFAALPTEVAAASSSVAAGGSKPKIGVVLGAVGGIVATVGVVCLAAAVIWKRRTVSRCGGGSSAKVTWESKRRTEVGPWTPPYTVFQEEEVEEMTGAFDHSNRVEEHRNTQLELYRGWLQDGTAVFVGRLQLPEKLSTSNLRQFADIVSKLRHHHLVDVLGHSIVLGNKNANETIVYLVFERFSNGTLRSHLSGRETMKWPQRVAAAVGVARGIQFLHTCGIYGNNINMEDIIMDEALTPKINNYSLPIPSGNKNNKKGTMGTAASNLSNQDMDIGSKEDIYEFGVILTELITGKYASNEEEFEELKLQLQKILTESLMELHKLVDPGIHGSYTYDSLRTMTEVTLSCLSRERGHRPSVDDVLWHLQYSIQVQYACASSGSLSVPSFSFAT